MRSDESRPKDILLIHDQTYRSIKDTRKGCCVIFWAFSLVTAYFGSVFLMSPFVILFLINKKLHQRVMNFFLRFWTGSFCIVFEYLFKPKIFIQSIGANPCDGKVDDAEILMADQSGSSLVIMNHLTLLDWIYFFCISRRFYSNQIYRIVLKASLRNVPGFGWGMLNACFVFLKRRIQLDAEVFENFCKWLSETSTKCNLLMFCEGTNLCKETRDVSWSFAEKQNLPRYSCVLNPRTTGFRFTVQCFRKTCPQSVKYIDDYTVIYKSPLMPSATEFFSGLVSREIYYFYKRYKLSDIPTEDQEIEKWCRDRWDEKEELIQRFLRDGKLVSKQNPPLELASFSQFWFHMLAWISIVVFFTWCVIKVKFITMYFVSVNIFYTVFAYYDRVFSCIYN